MVYFVAYDIADNKRLHKVAKILENFGLRVQYSFFECETDKQTMAQLRSRILNELDLTQDSLRIYPICSDCLAKSRLIGRGDVQKPQTFMIL